MNMKESRQSNLEINRTNDLESMFVRNGRLALDVGARDGHFSRILTGYSEKVVALDLNSPQILHEKIECVQGDITELKYKDSSFDFVLCTEVLEHIPCDQLKLACNELSRVTKDKLLIGVPYKQDIRVGRTSCLNCGKSNPPWGHVNSFDEFKLEKLFPHLTIDKISYVGSNKEATNFVSAFLLDIVGNPYGIYSQEEPCIFCGERLKQVNDRTLIQKIITKLSYRILAVQNLWTKTHANWVHVLFSKK